MAHISRGWYGFLKKTAAPDSGYTREKNSPAIFERLFCWLVRLILPAPTAQKLIDEFDIRGL